MRLVVALVAVVLLAGCATAPAISHVQAQEHAMPLSVCVVDLDGTTPPCPDPPPEAPEDTSAEPCVEYVEGGLNRSGGVRIRSFCSPGQSAGRMRKAIGQDDE